MQCLTGDVLLVAELSKILTAAVCIGMTGREACFRTRADSVAAATRGPTVREPRWVPPVLLRDTGAGDGHDDFVLVGHDGEE